jgi:hypothetical protein
LTNPWGPQAQRRKILDARRRPSGLTNTEGPLTKEGLIIRMNRIVNRSRTIPRRRTGRALLISATLLGGM